MKYIHYPMSVVDPTWQSRADAAKLETDAKSTVKERDKAIAKKSAIWRDMRPALEELSHGKCWYTEAKEKVSYWEVDHFRPKKLYPWLAFDWKNFRLSGGKPNRKKTDEFPLEDEATRAKSEAADHNLERPLLLDPARWGDADIITFKADGEPTCALPMDTFAIQRVRKTVETVGLDSAILCEERRNKWRECEDKLKRLRNLVETARQMVNKDAVEFSEVLCSDIAKLYSDSAEFTATAAACADELRAHRLIELARAVAARASSNQPGVPDQAA